MAKKKKASSIRTKAKKKKASGIHWRDRLVCDALRFLQKSGGTASVSDVLAHLQTVDKSDIPAEHLERAPSGAFRWSLAMQFGAVHFVTAGYLRRARGIWSITKLGIAELKKGNASISKKARDAFTESRSKVREEAARTEQADDDMPQGQDGDISAGDLLEGYYEDANLGIEKHIESMKPFVFQDLVAALFRGIGYHVREVSPQNTADGGADVIAYQGGDVFGAKPPRIKVQVKHREGKTGRPDLQKLLGAITTEGDIGVFVSTGGFTHGCRDLAKQQSKHVELIDMLRFIELWRDNYNKISDEDKTLLPLQPIYFLDKKRVKPEHL